MAERTTIDVSVSMRDIADASDILANTLEEKFKELGYRINSHGQVFNQNRTAVLNITVKYMSILRVFYENGSKKTQEKAQALVPKTYEYKGHDIPVQFTFYKQSENKSKEDWCSSDVDS